MINKITTISNSMVNSIEAVHIEQLYERISNYIENSRQNIQRSIDTQMVRAYWLIGQDIIEIEQNGKIRAEYGESLLKSLSDKLTLRYGKGFSVRTLEDARKFYQKYQETIIYKNSHAVRENSYQINLEFHLSWTHYRKLMRVTRIEARLFYENEAIKNNWSARELERQIGSLLFDRLAKSKDKEEIMALAYKGHEVNRPEDAIKDPFVLEFLGLPESHRLVESELEEALINNLQHFLLELGKGFAFIGRQKRITLDGDHFYADLVFYHVILKCYTIIEIKTQKLTHRDLGQMQLYVNYFDQEIKTDSDNPTIGLILCTEKNDATVKYTLGEKAKQIFASTYQFHLPTVEELEAELKREMKIIQYQLKEKTEEA